MRRSFLLGITVFTLLGTAGGVCQRRPPAAASDPSARRDLLHYDRPLAKLLDLSRLNRNAFVLRIEKSRYRLTIFVRGKAIKAYPVVFGCNPLDDKRSEGDCRTPEGTFRVRARYPHRRWSKFIWLDYPTAESWRKFREAKRRGKVGPEATIGGEIGIHGVPDRQDTLIESRTNWTLGCISLKTADIAEVYAVTKVGTRVKIVR